jgi:SAM-dependent methyltransferase
MKKIIFALLLVGQAAAMEGVAEKHNNNPKTFNSQKVDPEKRKNSKRLRDVMMQKIFKNGIVSHLPQIQHIMGPTGAISPEKISCLYELEKLSFSRQKILDAIKKTRTENPKAKEIYILEEASKDLGTVFLTYPLESGHTELPISLNSYLREHIEKHSSSSVLDVGSNYGFLILELEKLRFQGKYMGIDKKPKKELMHLLKEDGLDEKYELYPNSIDFCNPDAVNFLPKYTIIFCLNTFLYFENKPQAVENFRRVMDAESHLFISVPDDGKNEDLHSLFVGFELQKKTPLSEINNPNVKFFEMILKETGVINSLNLFNFYHFCLAK